MEKRRKEGKRDQLADTSLSLRRYWQPLICRDSSTKKASANSLNITAVMENTYGAEKNTIEDGKKEGENKESREI